MLKDLCTSKILFLKVLLNSILIDEQRKYNAKCFLGDHLCEECAEMHGPGSVACRAELPSYCHS